MPDRVKCLHALVAHELAVPGANPLGHEAVAAAGEWWQAGPCVTAAREAGAPPSTQQRRAGQRPREPRPGPP